MYFAKVFLHQIFFVLVYSGIYFYTELDLTVKILASLQAYIASYFVSLWTVKLIFKCCPDRKVKSKDNCILITGCDSGFGHQSAIQLNKLGFKVFATCLDPNGEGAKHLIEVADDPKKMIIITMDVTKDQDIESAYETVKSSLSYSECLFGLVNNAGIAIATEFEFGPDLTDGKKLIDVNLMGMMKVTRQFLPLIRQAKGRIVNIESFASFVPIPHSTFYGVAKAAAAGFSNNLRLEMYRHGVTVVSINPYFYKTAITDAKTLISLYKKSFRSSSTEIRKAYGEKFVQKSKTSISTSNFATESNAVPETIISALTAYEPDPRYIVAPIVFQPILRALLWLPSESFEVVFQTVGWIMGTHRVYPED